MLNKTEQITIIIPARNEEESILQTLQEIEKKVSVPYKLIVINDHSDDQTYKTVSQYIATKKNYSLINNKQQPGFAAAIRIGFKKATTPYVVVVMADLCDNPQTINKMFLKINQGWDIVCGSRYTEGGRKVGGSLLQGLCSRFVCFSLSYLLRIPTSDISNAFKMYRREILHNIYIDMTHGVETSMEITLQAFFQNAKITEIPTVWRGRVKGQSKFKIIQRTPKYGEIYLWAILKGIGDAIGFDFPLNRRGKRVI